MEFKNFFFPGKSWDSSASHGKSWKIMFIKKYKINKVFSQRKW